MRPIDADALYDELNERHYPFAMDADLSLADEQFRRGISFSMDFVKEAQTLDVVPVKRGHWIIDTSVHNIWGGICVECSECKTRYVVSNIADEKYCCNCGADMTGGFDETH